MRGDEPPEDGYAGEYVAELAAELAAAGVDRRRPRARSARAATEAMRERIEATLERFGVRYDTWSSERSLRESGAVERALEELRDARPRLRAARARSGCGRPSSATTRTGC